MEDLNEKFISERITADGPVKDDKSKKITSNEAIGYLKSIIITAIITSLILIFVAQLVTVNGDSMYPTLKNGQLLILEKISKKYERYSIIVIEGYDKLLVKRVIGLPGETIQMVDNKITVDGKEIEDVFEGEIYDRGIAEAPIVLGEDEYFVLGDNRNNSRDSRMLGPIKNSNILGRILCKLIPPGSIQTQNGH